MFNPLRHKQSVEKIPSTFPEQELVVEHTEFPAEAFKDEQRERLDEIANRLDNMATALLPSDGPTEVGRALPSEATLQASRSSNSYGAQRSIIYKKGNQTVELSVGHDNDQGRLVEVKVMSTADTGEIAEDFYMSDNEARVGGFHGARSSDPSFETTLSSAYELLAGLEAELAA